MAHTYLHYVSKVEAITHGLAWECLAVLLCFLQKSSVTLQRNAHMYQHMEGTRCMYHTVTHYFGINNVVISEFTIMRH